MFGKLRRRRTITLLDYTCCVMVHKLLRSIRQQTGMHIGDFGTGLDLRIEKELKGRDGWCQVVVAIQAGMGLLHDPIDLRFRLIGFKPNVPGATWQVVDGTIQDTTIDPPFRFSFVRPIPEPDIIKLHPIDDIEPWREFLKLPQDDRFA